MSVSDTGNREIPEAVTVFRSKSITRDCAGMALASKLVVFDQNVPCAAEDDLISGERQTANGSKGYQAQYGGATAPRSSIGAFAAFSRSSVGVKNAADDAAVPFPLS